MTRAAFLSCAVIFVCTSSVSAWAQSFDSLPPQRQDAIRAEAQTARKNCEGHGIYSAFYSCACIEENYPAARIAAGESMSQFEVLASFEKQCVDRPSIVRYSLDLCLKNAKRKYPNVPDAERETHCACAADGTAERFVKEPVNSARRQADYAIWARQACGAKDLVKRNEEAYRNLISGKAP